MSEVALWICLGAVALTAVRAVIGPTLADRVVAVDAALATLAAAMVIVAVNDADHTRLEPAVAVAFVGFIGTTVIARVAGRKPR